MICLLTYSMMQSPSWEANWFAASQEIPHISRNPKVHYRTHKRPPPVSILGQPNPVHIPTSHLLEIHPNIIHLSTPRSPHWSLSLRFPYPLLTHTRHMPSPSHSSRFYHPHNIGWGVQIIDIQYSIWMILYEHNFFLLGRYYNSKSFCIRMVIVQLQYIYMFTVCFLSYRAGSGHYTAFAINDGRLHFKFIFI